jgi:GT2 family glycosyltransferase
MRITAVVPVLNAERFLEPCLGSITAAMAGARHCEVDLVVVDNGSTDGSMEVLRERWSRHGRIIEAPGVSVGAVRNRGAREAGGDVLAFIDADCVVGPDYFDRAAAVLEETGASATGSSYSLPSEPHWIERSWHRLHQVEEHGPVQYLNAGNFLVRREVFEAVGGFDETLSTGEDAELGLRLVKAGHTIHADESVRAVHLGNPKSLGHFFRKQRWHGLGMFGTFRQEWRDLPVIATFTHLAATLAALVVLALAPLSWTSVAVAGFLFFVTPVTAVLFRASRIRRLPSPASVLLYHLYFAARLAALSLIIRGRAGGHRG